jgi:hypothetical protein
MLLKRLLKIFILSSLFNLSISNYSYAVGESPYIQYDRFLNKIYTTTPDPIHPSTKTDSLSKRFLGYLKSDVIKYFNENTNYNITEKKFNKYSLIIKSHNNDDIPERYQIHRVDIYIFDSNNLCVGYFLADPICTEYLNLGNEPIINQIKTLDKDNKFFSRVKVNKFKDYPVYFRKHTNNFFEVYFITESECILLDLFYPKDLEKELFKIEFKEN